jgi:hypothetical protein
MKGGGGKGSCLGLNCKYFKECMNKPVLSAHIFEEGRRRGRGADWVLTVNSLRSVGTNLFCPLIFAMKGGGGGGGADWALTVNSLRSLGTNLFCPLIFAMNVPEGGLHILQILQRLVLLLLNLPQLQLKHSLS